MVSKAQMKAVTKYTKNNYYRPNFIVKKEYEEIIRNRAAEKGLSVSAYIFDLIKKDLNIQEPKGNE